MRRTFIAAAAAGITVAATGFACAQERQPGQEQQAPATHRTESGKSGSGQGANVNEQTRQAQTQSGMERSKEENPQGADKAGKPGAAEQKGAEQRMHGQAEKANPAEKQKAAESGGERKMQNNGGTGKADNATGKTAGQRTGETEKGNRAEERHGQTASQENRAGEAQNGPAGERQNGQGEAGKTAKTGENEKTMGEGGGVHAMGNAHITDDRAAKIERTLMASATPQHVNINVNVGAVLPGEVDVRPLPPAVVSLVPEYEGYDYVAMNDEIVIVQPSTRHVVEIIGGDETQAMGTTHVGPCGP
jgi:hypothetical protein